MKDSDPGEAAPDFSPALAAMATAYAESGGDMRAVLGALAEFQLPTVAFYRAGIATGQLVKEHPSLRGGDVLAVQWKAVCLALMLPESSQ